MSDQPDFIVVPGWDFSRGTFGVMGDWSEAVAFEHQPIELDTESISVSMHISQQFLDDTFGPSEPWTGPDHSDTEYVEATARYAAEVKQLRMEHHLAALATADDFRRSVIELHSPAIIEGKFYSEHNGFDCPGCDPVPDREYDEDVYPDWPCTTYELAAGKLELPPRPEPPMREFQPRAGDMMPQHPNARCSLIPGLISGDLAEATSRFEINETLRSDKEQS